MTTRNLTDGDLKRMAEQGFKPKGWTNYKESPYKQYQETMERLGYERYDKPGNSTQDSRIAQS